MSNWLYYRPLTIDYTKIDSSLTDYPVMVKLDATNFSFSRIRSDGYDLIFTNDDGTVQYKHEIELFDSINEKAVYHVKIPSVSSTTDTVFRMYYGDPSVSVDQSDKVRVWDDNFVMVQHMGDSLVDSTGNGNNGTNYGSTVVDGLNGKARSFDGVNDYIDCGDFNPNTMTIQYLIKGYSSNNVHISKRNKSNYSFEMGLINNLPLFRINANAISVQSSTAITTTDYSLLQGTYDLTEIELWQNGVTKGTFTYSTAVNTSTTTVQIGRRGYTGEEEYTDGIIDEVRISNIARSDAWIKADDYNLRTNTLISVGAEDVTKTVTGIELIQEPTKKTYLLGENLNLTGALIEITYDDETTQQVEPTSATGFDSSVESLSQEVTISFGGFSDSFFVSISHDKSTGDYLAIKFTEKLNSPTLIADYLNNIALGKPYVSDGTLNNRGFSITDGNIATENYVSVAAASEPVYVEVDLEDIYDVTAVKIWHYYSDSRIYYDTKTEVSEDGETWATVFDSAVSGTYTETSSGIMHNFQTMKVRYIRDWLKGSNKNTGNHWVEIMVYGASLGYRPEGFSVSGYEYDWTYGPDYNSEITLKTYPVARVMKHPLYDDEYHLRLIMADSFKNAQGLISISYDLTLGDLAGNGGAQVESFTETFTPVGITPIFNPNAPDHLTITSDFAFEVKEVEYESYKLDEPADQIGIFPSSMSITVIHVGTLPL